MWVGTTSDTLIVGAPGRLLSHPLTFRVLDSYGRPLPRAAIGWRVTSGNGQLERADTAAAPDGAVQARWVLGTRASDVQSVTVETRVGGHQVATVAVTAAAIPVEVAALKIGAETTDVHLGAPVVLHAEATDPFGNHFVPTTLRFVSLVTGLVRLDSTGLASAQRRGYARVVAAANGVQDSAWVHAVQTVQAIVVNRDTLRFHALGQAESLSVALVDDHALPVADSLPAFVAADSGLVAVRPGAPFVVQSLTNGSTILHLAAGTVTRDVNLTVRQRTASLSFAATAFHFDAFKDTTRAKLNALDSLGVSVQMPHITLASADSQIATVDSSGLVTARGNGSVVLTARSASGVVATAPVTVGQRVAAIRPVADTARFDALNDTIGSSPVAFDRLGSVVAVPDLVLASSDTSVAAVDPAGHITARANGTVVVTIQAPSGVTATIQVVVAQRVAAVTVPRDSLRFEALHAVLPLGAVARDRLGSPVGAIPRYVSGDTSVITVDALGVARAVTNGTATLLAIADPDTARVSVVVSQKAVRVRVAKDTLRFDALGATDTVSAVALDSLGSLVSGPVTGLAIADTSVIQRTDSATVRSRGNGVTTATFTVAGRGADVIASVQQVPARIVASLTTADSVVDLAIGSVIPLVCEARDRNDYVVPVAPTIVPSSGARWIGARCDGLRVLRSGFDTLRLNAGPAQASLGLQLVVRPPDFPGAPSVVERVTAGPNETFVTWVPQDAPGEAAEVWTRTLGAASWDQKDVFDGRSWIALPGNAAGTNLEVALALTDGQGSLVGALLDTVTVEDGATCSEFAGYSSTDLRVFCTGPDLLTWVTTQGLDPQSVRCGNESLLALRDGLPNCVFEAGAERLVLLRGLDGQFRRGSPVSIPLLRAAFQSVLFGRSSPEATVWQDDPAIGTALPVARVGAVTGYQSAISWNTEVNSVGVITLFEPPNPNGAMAIYHEGHGGDATDIGAETISWLLQRGWSVIALNLPRVPHMALRDAHSDEDNPLWRMLYGIGQVTEWIHRSWAPGRDPVVVSIGRSGGGWASLLYAALDPRIDATAVVSSFVPISERLEDPAGRNVGDWEQIDPKTFGVLDYTDIVRLANTRDLLLTYSELDDCCFRLSSADPFAQWLNTEAGMAPANLTTVISGGEEHGLTPDGYAALQDFLDRALSRGH